MGGCCKPFVWARTDWRGAPVYGNSRAGNCCHTFWRVVHTTRSRTKGCDRILRAGNPFSLTLFLLRHSIPVAWASPGVCGAGFFDPLQWKRIWQILLRGGLSCTLQGGRDVYTGLLLWVEVPRDSTDRGPPQTKKRNIRSLLALAGRREKGE